MLLDDVRLPTGQQYEYTRLQGAGVGVGVIGFNGWRSIAGAPEYRHGVNQVVWQVPGGLAQADEDLQLAGLLSELAEETVHGPAQVTPETVRFLGMVWDNPGFSPMCSHIYAAWNLVPTGTVTIRPSL